MKRFATLLAVLAVVGFATPATVMAQAKDAPTAEKKAKGEKKTKAKKSKSSKKSAEKKS